MRLNQGVQAPIFITKDYQGKKINLSDYHGKRILLSFFRGASCPFCNLRVHELIKKQNEFKEQDIEIIAFFSSTKEEVQQYAGKKTPPFAVIPDPKFDIYKRYGVESSISGMMKAMLRMGTMVKIVMGGFFNMKSMSDKPLLPADFLIDENGMIYKAYYGSDFGDHIDLEEIVNW